MLEYKREQLERQVEARLEQKRLQYMLAHREKPRQEQDGRQDGMITIVKSLNGKPTTLFLQASDTINDVKAKLWDKIGLRPENQCLKLPAVGRLEDHRTLKDYNNPATLYMVPRIRAGLHRDHQLRRYYSGV